jgi:predicted O-linked N-acetylglucosamine transferase (SPINDLY family)
MMQEQTYELARQHHQAGRWAEAESLYRQIISNDPSRADAISALASLLKQTGRTDEAIALFQTLTQLQPDRPEHHGNLGVALARAGQVNGAIAAYRKALSLQPDLTHAHYNLGNALRQRGELPAAIDAYRQAVQLRPDYFEALNNLAGALKEADNAAEAVATYRAALALRPKVPETQHGLANALKDIGDVAGALAAYRRALELKPNFPDASNNLGTLFSSRNRWDEAIVAYRAALAARPDYAEAHSNLGNALKNLGELDDATAHFDRSLQIQPNIAAASNRLYTMYFHPRYTAEHIRDEHRRWNDAQARPLLPAPLAFDNDPAPDRRLRLGYVSPDFREHCQTFFTLPLLSHHDHARFEIYCYSSVARPDAYTRRLEAHVEVWRDVTRLSDEALAKVIRDDQIDICVDLTMHMARGRPLLFARKPAPVQMAWLAYPGTTGLTAMDYRLTDPRLDPPDTDGHYVERSVRLPDTFWCYDPLTTEPPPNDLPALANGFVTLGCLNNFCKLNDDVLDAWSKVMLALPDARLLMLAPLGSARDRLLERVKQRHVDPRRIEFVAYQPRAQYLATYHRIDLALDTFPYNGHTTTLDACWMGVPTVSLAGATAAARGGLSILSNLGQDDWVARTSEQYVGIATALARDLPRLRDARATLRQRMQSSPLMDASRFARSVEEACRNMWRTWCAAARQS